MGTMSLPEYIKARIEANRLTPEQIKEELQKHVVTVKEQVKRLEEAKKISPELWQWRATI
jgi:hypothetical protein